MLISRFAFCICLLFSPLAMAGQILAVGTEFAHVFECNSDGGCNGLAVDILRALAKQNGDTISFQIYPWTRAQSMVENSQAQILIGPYKTAEREIKFSFAQKPFYQDVMAFYVRQEAKSAAWDGNYASFGEGKVAVINGWVYGPKFEPMRTSMKPTLANSLENGLNMLVAKRIDYLATNLRNSDALVAKMGLARKVTILQPYIDKQEGYFAYCKTSCDLLRTKYDELFEQLRTSNALQEMAQRHEVRLP